MLKLRMDERVFNFKNVPALIKVNLKNNGFWMNAIIDWKLYGKDNYTERKKLIESVTPEDISSYIKNVILKSGNHAEVIMRPE